MYSTCLYCNGKLGANDMIERFPIGRRIAFDAAKGRLWIVCMGCQRWNLTPMEERYEAIEDCERLYRSTSIRVSTGNIGLARMRDGLELVRIGAPLRPEFAAWRYAGEFFSRRNRSYARAGATTLGMTGLSAGIGAVMGPVVAGAGALSVIALPVLAMALVAVPVLGKAMATDYMEYERVLGRFNVDGRIVRVRAKHARSIDLAFYGGSEAELGLQHDGGWITMSGPRAMHATTVLLANTNSRGASNLVVPTAVDQIERCGNSTGYLESASRKNGWRSLRPVSVLNAFRKLGPMNLTSAERLALEMAVHEETERRAFQGELNALKEAWIEAEQIAGIVDGMLTPLQ
jgi:hypothetical protein